MITLSQTWLPQTLTHSISGRCYTSLGSALSKLEVFAIQIHWSFHSKFKISLLHHTHHCGIWIWPFPAEFQPQLDSMKSHSDAELAGQDHAASPAPCSWEAGAEAGLQLPLNEKGSWGQRTLIRRWLKHQGSAPEPSHKMCATVPCWAKREHLAGQGWGLCCYCTGLLREEETTLIAPCPGRGCAHWLLFIPQWCEVHCKNNLFYSTALLVPVKQSKVRMLVNGPKWRLKGNWALGWNG